MGNQSISPPETRENFSFEDCREHCSCYYSTLKAMAEGYLTDDIFSEYVSEPLRHDYSLIPENRKGQKKLTEEDTDFFLGCVKEWADHIIDNDDYHFPEKLLSLVNKIYLEKEFHESWEYCLDHKHKPDGEKKYHDYLYGCNSGCKDDPDALKHRHGHQFCISNESLQKAEELLILDDKLEAWLKESKSFDDLYATFRNEANNSISGLGPLCVYDACLRIAWNENRELMPEKIYFHSGVKWGAEALYHISRLAGLDWYVGALDPKEISPDDPTDPALFNGFLPEIPGVKDRTHHLENLLCCFHEPFFLLETAIRVKQTEKTGKPVELRRNPDSIINNAKKALGRAKAKSKSEGKTLKKTNYEDYIRPQDRRYLKLLKFSSSDN
ncbi:MAG: hypothetical protein K2I92_03290 [Muribaculaceae bacterium]|nr:hypothetical protein [Muribaculaceae bacterium]